MLSLRNQNKQVIKATPKQPTTHTTTNPVRQSNCTSARNCGTQYGSLTHLTILRNFTGTKFSPCLRDERKNMKYRSGLEGSNKVNVLTSSMHSRIGMLQNEHSQCCKRQQLPSPFSWPLFFLTLKSPLDFSLFFGVQRDLFVWASYFVQLFLLRLFLWGVELNFLEGGH